MKFIIKICLEKYAAAVAALLHHLPLPLGPITSFSVSTFLLQKFAFAAAESIECTAAAVLCCAVACLIRQVLDVTCLRPYAWYKNCLQVNKKKEMHTPSTVWRAKSLSFQLIPRFDKWNRCMRRRRRRRRRDELADSRQPWDGMAWGCLVMQSSSFPPSPLNAQVTTTISFSTTPLLFFFFGRNEFTRKQKWR